MIAIALSGKGPVAFDAGRATQNMMLAAWNEGVVSCPNGIEADHLTREPLDYLAEEGFELESSERARLGIVERIVARRTA
ncbi:MAG: hypothetical protein ACRDL3_00020 [Solirubrobacterales bacterium]